MLPFEKTAFIPPTGLTGNLHISPHPRGPREVWIDNGPRSSIPGSVLPSIKIALPVGADPGNPCGNPENWKPGVSSGTFLILRSFIETLLLSG